MLIGAQGLLRTVEDGEATVWYRAAVASDLELAEHVLRKQADKWRGTAEVLREITRIRLSVNFGERLGIEGVAS